MYTKLKISDMLKDLGIPASLSGYQYLRYAIEISMKDPDYIFKITKKMYPEVARYFHSTSTRVERAMRNAIEVGWGRGNIHTQERLFGYTVDAMRGHPTNGEFVATIADYFSIMLKGDSDGS